MQKTLQNKPDQRVDERISVEIPVQIGDYAGLSRDISANGIMLEMDETAEIGDEISFEINLDTPAGKISLKGLGSILRTEAKQGKTAIAVKIIDSHLTRV